MPEVMKALSDSDEEAGRQKRREKAYTEKQAKKAIADSGGSWYGGFKTPPFSPGGSSSFKACQGKLPEVPLGSVCLSSPMSDRNSSRRRDRQSVGGVLQPPLQRGRRQSCWGLHSGGFDGQISELQQVWPSEDTKTLEGPPGLEETMPSQVSVGLSAASVVGFRGGWWLVVM